MKFYKPLICLAGIALLAAIWYLNRPERAAPFTLSMEEIITSLESMDGKVVAISITDTNAKYRWHGEVTVPYSANEEDEGTGSTGMTRAGLSMSFPIAFDHYHVIHIYDASDGGALIVGRKIAKQENAADSR
ncbi:hypothetical protein [Luteolibacter sp. AS25]|uniref:hypothetical protein n=1 Tax=Luteolibacter sp. AS25 TaxID=3135776 RepID=UPI00398ACB0C